MWSPTLPLRPMFRDVPSDRAYPPTNWTTTDQLTAVIEIRADHGPRGPSVSSSAQLGVYDRTRVRAPATDLAQAEEHAALATAHMARSLAPSVCRTTHAGLLIRLTRGLSDLHAFQQPICVPRRHARPRLLWALRAPVRAVTPGSSPRHRGTYLVRSHSGPLADL